MGRRSRSRSRKKNWRRSRRFSTRRTPTPASPPPTTCSPNFADTEFKAIALQVAAASAQQKNDFEKMVVYAERTLEADPKNYPAMLMLASGIAQRTREFDLDKEEKLGRAEKYANSAIELVKGRPKAAPRHPGCGLGSRQSRTTWPRDMKLSVWPRWFARSMTMRPRNSSRPSAASPDPATDGPPRIRLQPGEEARSGARNTRQTERDAGPASVDQSGGGAGAEQRCEVKGRRGSGCCQAGNTRNLHSCDAANACAVANPAPAK